VDHSAKISQHDLYTSVWFQFNGFGTIKASATGYTGRLTSKIARFDRSAAARFFSALRLSVLLRTHPSEILQEHSWSHLDASRWRQYRDSGMQASQSKVGVRVLRPSRRAAGRCPYLLPQLTYQSACNPLQSDAPLQLCGRRTFYQLLVCDNAKDTDVGAPYYSDQQLFPGFMMAEFDGDSLSFSPFHLPPNPVINLQPVAFHQSISPVSQANAG
jgi:hypothetical protein